MASFGLSDSGFLVKRLQDILTEQRQKAVELFQDLVLPGDIVDTTDSSTIGRFISLDSPGDADLWEVAQQVYSAFDPNSATGIALDNLVALNGMPPRFQNTYTTAQVLLSGASNTNIPAGSLVSSSFTKQNFALLSGVVLNLLDVNSLQLAITTVSSNTEYSISFSRLGLTTVISYTSDTTATSSEILAGLKAQADLHPEIVCTTTATNITIAFADLFATGNFSLSDNIGVVEITKTGDVQAVDFGPTAQSPNTIDTIPVPILGWTSVNNPATAIPGRYRESDEELRLRFRNSKFERATGSIEAIYSALTNLSNVSRVFINENDTSVVNSYGTPPHSFLCLVVGGVSAEIAKAIWQNRPAGILSYGNISVQIQDSFGYIRQVAFSRPDIVPIYVELQLVTNSAFPTNGQDLIKQALIDYINSLEFGEPIVYSRLYTPINSVPGHEVTSLKIDTVSPPTGTSNITLAFDKLAQLLPTNIVFV